MAEVNGATRNVATSVIAEMWWDKYEYREYTHHEPQLNTTSRATTENKTSLPSLPALPSSQYLVGDSPPVHYHGVIKQSVQQP